MVCNIGEPTMSLIKKIFCDGYKSIIGLLSGLVTLFMPAVPALLTAFAFIFADAYYGYKVSKLNGYREIESNKVWKTINKLTEALVIICLALLLDKYILDTMEQLYAVKVAAGSVCLAEALSLLECFRALHPNALLAKILAKVIKSKSEKYLETDISDIIDNKDDTNKDIVKPSKNRCK